MDVVELPVVWRAAVAARDFAVGEEILREPPLMLLPKVRRNTPLFDALDAIACRHSLAENVLYPLIYYCRVSPAVKEKIREFYVPDLEESSNLMKHFHGAVEEVMQLPEFQDKGVTFKELLDFILLLRINVHALGDETSALFYLGSKVTHSCAPNCMALAIGTRLVYRAIQPIPKGEPITFSYISGWDLWKSTPARRALLQEQRFFQCCCLRCVREDRCRLMICPACGDHQLLRYETGQLSYLGPDPNPPTDTPWTCTNANCGKKFKDEDMPLNLETRLQKQILETFFSTDKFTSSPYATAQGLLQLCEGKLGRHHWLTALMVYTHLALHHSAFNKNAKPESSGKDALTWASRLFNWTEHAMPGTMQHAVIAKFAGQTAEVYGINQLATEWFVRAIPILRLHQGVRSSEVIEMVAFIKKHGTRAQLEAVLRPGHHLTPAPPEQAAVAFVDQRAPAAAPGGPPGGPVSASTPAAVDTPTDPAVLKKMAKREKVKERRRKSNQRMPTASSLDLAGGKA